MKEETEVKIYKRLSKLLIGSLIICGLSSNYYGKSQTYTMTYIAKDGLIVERNIEEGKTVFFNHNIMQLRNVYYRYTTSSCLRHGDLNEYKALSNLGNGRVGIVLENYTTLDEAYKNELLALGMIRGDRLIRWNIEVSECVETEDGMDIYLEIIPAQFNKVYVDPEDARYIEKFKGGSPYQYGYDGTRVSLTKLDDSFGRHFIGWYRVNERTKEEKMITRIDGSGTPSYIIRNTDAVDSVIKILGKWEQTEPMLLDRTIIDFGQIDIGEQVSSQEIVVTNTSKYDGSLLKPQSTYFEIEGEGTKETLPGYGKVIYKLAPKSDLVEGKYSEKIEIKAEEGVSITCEVSCEIIDKNKTSQKAPTKKPEESSTTEASKEPGESSTTEASKEPGESSTTEASKELEESSTTEASKEPEESSTTEASKEPEESSTTEVSKKPEEDLTTEANKKPKEESIIEVSKRPEEKPTTETSKKLEKEQTTEVSRTLEEEPTTETSSGINNRLQEASSTSSNATSVSKSSSDKKAEDTIDWKAIRERAQKENGKVRIDIGNSIEIPKELFNCDLRIVSTTFVYTPRKENQLQSPIRNDQRTEHYYLDINMEEGLSGLIQIQTDLPSNHHIILRPELKSENQGKYAVLYRLHDDRKQLMQVSLINKEGRAEFNVATTSGKYVMSVAGETYIKLTIGDNVSYLNGKTMRNDKGAEIVNNVTLVPLRFIAEAMGANV